MIGVLGLMTLFSCNKTDFTNPEEVVKSYRALTIEYKHEKVYDEFLSSKSKEFVTKDEFLRDRYRPDSILKLRVPLESKLTSFSVDINNPTYRRFKVDEKTIFNNDTIYDRFYYSLINENGEWKVIWTSTLYSFAVEKYYDGNYSEARKTFDKIIEIDPFSGRTYSHLAWSFLRDKSLSKDDREKGIVENAKYAISLEEDYSGHYNTLAVYYSDIGNVDLAIHNYERGLSYCQNKSDRRTFYSNLAGSYNTKGNYKKAEDYVNKSIKIDDKDTFAWYMYGVIMRNQNKNDKAIRYFQKALKQDEMENSLQGHLYYLYSLTCFEMRKCGVAKEYISKALDIEPSNNSYQSLFNQIKYCN